MAATYTQAQIDALSAAMAQGVLSVTYAGPPARTVVFQSRAEMEAQLAAMVAYVDRATRRRFRLAAHRKGF